MHVLFVGLGAKYVSDQQAMSELVDGEYTTACNHVVSYVHGYYTHLGLKRMKMRSF